MSSSDHEHVQFVNEILALTGRPDRATDRTRVALKFAELAAREFSSPAIDTRHLICGLIREAYGVAFHVLSDLGLKSEAFNALLRALPNSNQPPALQLGSELAQAMRDSWTSALEMNHNYIGTEHLLLGIVTSQTLGSKLLIQLGIDSNTVKSKIRSLHGAHN